MPAILIENLIMIIFKSCSDETNEINWKRNIYSFVYHFVYSFTYLKKNTIVKLFLSFINSYYLTEIGVEVFFFVVTYFCNNQSIHNKMEECTNFHQNL